MRPLLINSLFVNTPPILCCDQDAISFSELEMNLNEAL
jgi:hypothetical protein